MDVRIGVTYTPKELTLEMDGTVDDVTSEVESAIDGNGSFLWLTDRRGHRVGVPLDKLAYVEIESGEGDKHVGFGD